MARRTRLSYPPRTDNPALDGWLQNLYSEINNLPNFSIVSFTDGPNSNETADPGTILLDVGSTITKAWVKQSGSTNIGWVALDN